MILDKILTYLKTQAKKERTHHYPSDITSCTRKIYYSWKKVEPSNPKDEKTLVVFEIGHGLHERFQKIIKESYLESADEVEIKSKLDPNQKYDISGRMDSEIWINGIPFGIEFKTIKEYGFKLVKENGAKEEHIWQVVCYMEMDPRIKTYYIIYVEKSSGECFETVISKRQDGYYEGDKLLEYVNSDILKAKISYIEECLEKDVLPNRVGMAAIRNGEVVEMFQKDKKKHKTFWECKLCEYLNHCWSKELIQYKDSTNHEMFKESN